MSMKLHLPFALVWPVMVAAGAAGCLLAARCARSGSAALLAVVLLCAFAAAAIYFSLRLLVFRRRLANCLRRMRQGEYTTGIHQVEWLADDVTALTALTNETVERLAFYDELRADRVALHSRALETVLRTVEMAVMVADTEARTLRLNASLQRAFGINRETFAFEEIERQPENERFVKLFMLGVYKDKTVVDGAAQLQLLASRGVRQVEVRVVPLKDRKEQVRFAVIFIAVQAAPPAEPATDGARTPPAAATAGTPPPDPAAAPEKP
jgi:nitrogen fixation/metabolism regulation signal transduction histidine kinase